ncbi:MAG: mevalonate kinase [Candidatus Kariarchaeaceae archaeon]
MEVIASSPGKTILFGEHSVVYGRKALAIAISPRVRAKVSSNDSLGVEVRSEALNLNHLSTYNSQTKKWDPIPPGSFTSIYAAIENIGKETENLDLLNNLLLEITSDLPVGSGVGSSAATATATLAALNQWWGVNLSLKKISELAFLSEEITHGKPSGIDNSVSTFGGLISFEDGTIEFHSLPYSLPLVVADSGVPKQTSLQVQKVITLKQQSPEVVDKTLDAMHELSERAIPAILNKNLKILGDLMNTNHELLVSLGVSHEKLDYLCEIARKAGAVGAKLTGAGGGGTIIALAPSFNDIEKIVKALKSEGATIIASEISIEGVKIEQY